MFDVLFDAAWAQALTAWLATYALHSTVLLGVAWLASRWLTSALALDALWKPAVLAGFVTTSVQMAMQPSVQSVLIRCSPFSPGGWPWIKMSPPGEYPPARARAISSGWG